MKKLIIILTTAITASLSAQCYKIDTVRNHTHLQTIANRPVDFGIIATAEQLISNKYSLCDSGIKVELALNTIAVPQRLINIMGIQLLKRDYIVNMSITANNITHYSRNVKTVYVNAMFLTVEQIPENKKAYSKAVEKCLIDLVKKL
jgi:hypothetical protein